MKDKCSWIALHCVLQRVRTWAWLLLVQEFVSEGVGVQKVW